MGMRVCTHTVVIGGGVKEILAAHGLLERWFAFEAARMKEALESWCEANQIKVVPSSTKSA